MTCGGMGIARATPSPQDEWKRKIGAKQLERLESDLTALVGTSSVRVDSPGWIANSLDEAT
jgi:hypothetical protein